MIVGRTLGSVLLARLEKRQLDVAKACRCSRAAVGHWMTGRHRPGGDARLTLRDAFAIPLEAWVTTPGDDSAGRMLGT